VPHRRQGWQGRAERRDVARRGSAFQRLEHRARIVALDKQDLPADHAALQFARAPERGEPAAVDECDPVAVLGFVHVVGGDDDTDAFAGERVDQVPEAAARGRVDSGGRLVEKEDRRFV